MNSDSKLDYVDALTTKIVIPGRDDVTSMIYANSIKTPHQIRFHFQILNATFSILKIH